MKLLDLALRLKWSSIIDRASEPEYAHEIREQDGDGLTVLHWACCNDPPPRVILALLEIDAATGTDSGDAKESHADSSNKDVTPQNNRNCLAALKKDTNGMTPLLNACACQASIPVIQSLIQAAPESISIQDNDGWNALHYLCYNIKHGLSGIAYVYTVANRLLVVDRSIVEQRDANCQTPLSLLCQSYEDEIQCGCSVTTATTMRIASDHRNSNNHPHHQQQASNLVDFSNHGAIDPDRIHGLSTPVRNFWALASLIIQNLVLHNNDDDIDNCQSASYLHNIALLSECPRGLIRVALDLYADQLLTRDSRGNTPLHLAASSVSSSALRADAALAVAGPNAAKIRNANGDLPLAIALKTNCGFTKGHIRIIDANPSGLEACDVQEIYYPHLLSRLDSSSTIFEILKAKPSLVRDHAAV